ncbi:MAG: adenylate/guanylate cyclase domain-containing protein, partial [Saprospiraceae bacterium]
LDSLEVEGETMQAILNTQTEAIEALSDTQMRQMLLLRQQRLELDSFSIVALEDSLLLTQQEVRLMEQRSTAESQRLQRNFLILLALGVLGLAGVLYSRFRQGRRYQGRLEDQNKVIATERARSDELLLNILPPAVARELKDEGKARARHYGAVSVLMADFKGFTQLSRRLDPQQLIDALDEAFRAFDVIVREERLEKIKTIGDAYLCVAGIPDRGDDHAERAVRAAARMQEYLKTNEHFDARIGIHTGPVVAGVVGLHKFAFDIWGDTVNLAARLETAGEVGRVNVSAAVCELLPPRFNCIARGELPVKNAGRLSMFFVEVPD